MLEELRYRLGYCILPLPTLAERREDITGLAMHLLGRCPEATGEPGPTRFAPEVLSLFHAAAWPGNVRQLEMVVRDAYLRARRSDMVRLSDLSDVVHLSVGFKRRGDAAQNAKAIQVALEVTRGRVDRAAKLLRTSRTTIYNYLEAGSGTQSFREGSRVNSSSAPA